jgi:hypothetical protein
MKDAIQEATRLIDRNCKKCQVSKIIKKEHGHQSKLEYCQSVCTIGAKIKELNLEINHGYRVQAGLRCTEENYLYWKSTGLTDKAISQKYGISPSTLRRRKQNWDIEEARPKLSDRTVEEFFELKKDHLSDREIARRWNVGHGSLTDWKKEKGLKRINYLEGRTKQEYLDLKVQGKTDIEIARAWKVWRGALQQWKKEHNLRGGLR